MRPTAASLDERLLRMTQILTSSTRVVTRCFSSGQRCNASGFIAYNPAGLFRLINKTIRVLHDRRPLSLDLGCGNGGWTLMAAAAGFPSLGIDINSFLIAHAERNHRTARDQGLIDPQTRCEFSVGNMYPAGYRPTHSRVSEEAVGPNINVDAYQSLGVKLQDAGIIYAYAWPSEMPFLCRFLAENASPDTILVLPLYATGNYNKDLRLRSLDPTERHFCIGQKEG